MRRITGLFIYPFKSLQGIRVSEVAFTPRGFADDRIFMLVDEQGRMVTLREYPRLATIRVAVPAGDSFNYAVGRPDVGRILIPRVELDPRTHQAQTVIIHDQESVMLRVGKQEDEFFSACLKQSVRLVRASKSHPRIRKIGEDTQLALNAQDAYPVTILSEASLRDLNKRLSAMRVNPVTLDRFRPNIYMDGDDTPHAEDRLAPIIFGEDTVFNRVKLCSRCRAVTVHVDSGSKRFGQFDMNNEPLKTLVSYRQVYREGKDPHAYFAVNAVPERSGRLNVGMQVTE